LRECRIGSNSRVLSVSAEVAVPGITLRTASVLEIDTLYAIDLDASRLYEQAGLRMEFSSDHEFIVAERARWQQCLSAGTCLLATDTRGEPLGFAATGQLDGEPYLDQLSVRVSAMRRGIGTLLLDAVTEMVSDTGGRTLWLITYSQLRWNRPFYERRGFVAVPEDRCGPEIRHELSYQRRWLPLPQQRLVMQIMPTLVTRA